MIHKTYEVSKCKESNIKYKLLWMLETVMMEAKEI